MTVDDWKDAKELARDILKDCAKPYTAQQLAEIPVIMNVKNKYFWCVDHQEWDLMEEVFVEEGLRTYWNGQPGVTVREMQVEQNKGICNDTMVPMHMGHNMIVKFLDDTHARLLTRLNDYHTYKDDDSTYEGFGYYVDDLEKGADGIWRIQILRLTYRVILGALRS
ncbi:MAG: nuclear transport factor 2 family protein [Lachnospiraceae bacterium]|nr:nuclear transport factor 2 family protein [Lachnospiraceae bacterium]